MRKNGSLIPEIFHIQALFTGNYYINKQHQFIEKTMAIVSNLFDYKNVILTSRPIWFENACVIGRWPLKFYKMTIYLCPKYNLKNFPNYIECKSFRSLSLSSSKILNITGEI